jgi:hypothetical protein
LTFENLFDTNDRPYEIIVYLDRNETNRIINFPSLNGWKIESLIPGTETNKISYSISSVTDSTGHLSTITKDDSVTYDIIFDELLLRSITGTLKPITADLEESGFKLDYGNINEKLNYAEVNFRDASFVLNLHSSSDINLRIDGVLLGDNGISTLTKSIEGILIPSEELVEVDISDLINGFTQVLPDSFSLQGNALLNPFYQSATVERGDSIFGDIEFEIPLDVGIAAGSFRDTFDVDLGDVDEDDIDRINYGEVTFQITNSVPVGLIVTSAILDSNYNEVLNIPTPGNSLDYIEVPNPDVSGNGEILSASSITQTITVIGDDVKRILDNPYMMLVINFNTAGIWNFNIIQ